MIQIIGTKKCKITQKALRFFRERGVDTHFLDVAVRPLAPGELDNCVRAVGNLQVLLNTNGSRWSERGMDHLECDLREELLGDMDLLLTPVVRQGKTACVGNDEAVWKKMSAAEKG